MRFVLTLLPLLVYGICQVHANSYATCYGTGDPHMLSLDGQRYDFMGGDELGRECKFLFLGSCKAKNVPHFRILVSFTHRGNPRVSYVKALELHLGGHVVRIDGVLNSRGQISVDGRIHSGNNYGGVQGLTVTRFPPCETRFSFAGGRIMLTYRRPRDYAQVKVHASLKGAGLCGMCGNYDGNRYNDQRKRNGQPGNWNDVGWSWEAPDKNGKYCSHNIPPPCPHKNCPAAARCVALKKESVFGECVRHLHYYDSCAEDVCCAPAHFKLCETFRAYVRLCNSIGVSVPSTWERDSRCEDPPCPANSKYDQTASPCQPTCKGHIIGCNKSMKKGACVCNPGYIWSDINTCIPCGKC